MKYIKMSIIALLVIQMSMCFGMMELIYIDDERGTACNGGRTCQLVEEKGKQEDVNRLIACGLTEFPYERAFWGALDFVSKCRRHGNTALHSLVTERPTSPFLEIILSCVTFSPSRSNDDEQRATERGTELALTLGAAGVQFPGDALKKILVHLGDVHKQVVREAFACAEDRRDLYPLLQYPHEWLKGARGKISDEQLVGALTDFRFQQGQQELFRRDSDGRTPFDLLSTGFSERGLQEKAVSEEFKQKVRTLIRDNVQKELRLARQG